MEGAVLRILGIRRGRLDSCIVEWRETQNSGGGSYRIAWPLGVRIQSILRIARSKPQNSAREIPSYIEQENAIITNYFQPHSRLPGVESSNR